MLERIEAPIRDAGAAGVQRYPVTMLEASLRSNPLARWTLHVLGFLAASHLLERALVAAAVASGLDPGASAACTAASGPAWLPEGIGDPAWQGGWAPACTPHIASGGARWAPLLLTAVLEELFFRGLVFEIARRALGATGAVLVSALLFGAAHPGLGAGAAAALLGAMLAGFRLAHGLGLPMLAHAANNALAFGLARKVAPPFPGLTPPDAVPTWTTAPATIGVALLLTGSSLVVLRQSLRSPARPGTTEASQASDDPAT